MTSAISIIVTHRVTSYPVTLPPDSTLGSLYTCLEELTGVPPSLQKLLFKGKKTVNDDTSIREAGIKHGLKVQLIGSTPQEISGLNAVEDEQRKKSHILRERALKAPTKVRSTGTSSSAESSYRFHHLESLQHLPNPSSALEILTRLSNDPAIRHIMQQHKFSVGLLTELAPHENPGLLGLNVNAGQTIKLRLRTDEYDGFRWYKHIRMVLCHELAHNVHGNHDNDFKELNSKLNREVAKFERSAKEGTHSLMEDVDIYDPSMSDLDTIEAHSHVLGGSDAISTTFLDTESTDERRRRMLEATMRRLRKEEEQLKDGCGTGRSSESGTHD